MTQSAGPYKARKSQSLWATQRQECATHAREAIPRNSNATPHADEVVRRARHTREKQIGKSEIKNSKSARIRIEHKESKWEPIRINESIWDEKSPTFSDPGNTEDLLGICFCIPGNTEIMICIMYLRSRIYCTYDIKRFWTCFWYLFVDWEHDYFVKKIVLLASLTGMLSRRG